jgi:serine/threonine protein kinase/predicted esterase
MSGRLAAPVTWFYLAANPSRHGEARVPDLLEHLRAALSDRYTIEREIGRGGMATVYLAHDLKHDRHVALKVLHAEVASTVGRERFLREIQITARLNHPNILTLIDSGEAGDVLYYVLPLVDGESLRERLDRDGRLEPGETAKLVGQIADAIDYAHEQGVLHRDIKPENILLHRGTAMVSDFGIAVGLAAARDERLTETGTSIGTPSYMSPEQIEAETKVDERSDVYAVGCLAYEMLVGEPPYTGSSQTIFAKILTTDPPDVSDHRDDVPVEVCRATARAQARSPESRYGTVGEFAAALRDATASDRAAAGARSPGAVTAFIAIAAIAILVFFGWRLVAGGGADGSAAIALAQIDDAVRDGAWIEAWQMARALEGTVSDSVMTRIWSEVGIPDTITSDPSGAAVSWRPFTTPDSSWQPLGVTPLVTYMPRAEIALRLELEGYEPRLGGSLPAWTNMESRWRLQPAGDASPEVVHVPGSSVPMSWNSSSLGAAPARPVGEFLIDQYEVTNARYREFVEAGGYSNPEFWQQPIERDGRLLDWDEAMALMVDRTGRPGPSSWEVGTYRDGEGELPVTGVSWYEAMAFARWAGRSLPTIYHWHAAAFAILSWPVVPLSNFNGEGPRAVGERATANVFGVYDMAGNAREWVVNAQDGARFALGGGWTDADYYFSVAYPLPPLDRGPANGFRLITPLADSDEVASLGGPVPKLERDFRTETPVSDEVFDVFLSLYDYDRSSVNPEIERVDTVPSGIRQRITLDTADGSDRIILYLFLPSEPTRPLQTIFYWPGGGVLLGGSAESFFDRSTTLPALVRSGRAVAVPVFESMWEREDDFEYRRQDPSNDHRDHVISWRQDLGRILDYLETRPDIDPDGFSYFGHSWGGRMGAIMLAVEPRFRAGVLYVGGLSLKPTQPVVEPLNFAPRVKTPVLMLNGRYDPIYPLETQSMPLFDMLGSEHKAHYIAEGSHNVPYVELVRESLRWLDTYVGPVE